MIKNTLKKLFVDSLKQMTRSRWGQNFLQAAVWQIVSQMSEAPDVHWAQSFLDTIAMHLLSRVSASPDFRWGQSVLEKSVLHAQYLQGIGSGGDVFTSGEAAIFTKLNDDNLDLKRDLCIFDVGANRGQFLNLACNSLPGRKFTIHSFEPSRQTYDQLCSNTRQYKNAVLNNFGLGRESGESELFYDAHGSGLASLTKRRLDHFGLHMERSEKVQISTIDDYCGDHGIDHIDLLKIDVEGHELDVLRGSARMFSKSAIAMVTFEFGGCDIDTRTFFQDFFYFFQDHQMQIARITPTGHFFELRSYLEVFEQFRTTNFVCYRY